MASIEERLNILESQLEEMRDGTYYESSLGSVTIGDVGRHELGIRIADAEGKDRARIILQSDGSVGVQLHDAEGHARFQQFVNSKDVLLYRYLSDGKKFVMSNGMPDDVYRFEEVLARLKRIEKKLGLKHPKQAADDPDEIPED